MKHANVAIFVPHNGCPHQCSFCNQRQITGQNAQPAPGDVVNAVNIALKSGKCSGENSEIAFFGGSFTAIDKEYMESLLKSAYPFIKKGCFKGIRISTRPDCIDSGILQVLKNYGVTSVELGAQSMDDGVLYANHRGHTSNDVRIASELIKDAGFSLGLQMMTGLYKSDDKKDIKTAEDLISIKPDTVRIYPTVIMKNTELETLYNNGLYKAADVDESVNLCAKLLCMFEKSGIKVIRLGLHSSEGIENDRVAGPWHPAFSELCQSKILLDKLLNEIKEKKIKSDCINVCVNNRTVSKLTGQKRNNIKQLENMGFGVKITIDDSLKNNEFNII